MKTLSIDIETYSDQNLAKTGVYRYVESSVFQIVDVIAQVADVELRILLEQRYLCGATWEEITMNLYHNRLVLSQFQSIEGRIFQISD